MLEGAQISALTAIFKESLANHETGYAATLKLATNAKKKCSKKQIEDLHEKVKSMFWKGMPKKSESTKISHV